MHQSVGSERAASGWRMILRTKILVLTLIVITISANLNAAQIQLQQPISTAANRLLVISVATNPDNEAFQRFNRSIDAYKLDLNVLGANERWLDQPESASVQRADLLKQALSSYKNDQDLVILIVDAYSSILNAGRREILDRFDKFAPKSRIVFAAESISRPNEPSLELEYPPAGAPGELRFLNSGAFIGFASELWALLNLDKSEVKSSAPGTQLYFARAYLNSQVRSRLSIGLDHQAELFQSLSSSGNDMVELEFGTNNVDLKNQVYRTEPVVVLGTGASRVVLNSLGNYLGKAWTIQDGCRYCNDSMISLSGTRDSELPTVLVGAFIEEPTPFLEQFFENIHRLDYPRERIHLFIHNSIEYHERQVETFVEEHGGEYASKQVISSYKQPLMNEWEARNFGLDKCAKQLTGCDYYLALDSVARLENPNSLRLLIETNRPILAPLLSRPNKLWSNFWGALTPEGYYARSHDYVELVRRDRVGVWNVPHIMNAYLIQANLIRESLAELTDRANGSTKLTYHEQGLQLKPVLTFTHQLRASPTGVSQFMVNTHEFGHLIDPTNYDLNRTHPDFYQLDDNMIDWERRYLHENYSHLLDEETKLEQPCQDVFWFPLVNDRFCEQLIEIMESFGKWSGGTSEDPRIEGGYESVPTRDIHFKQVGLHEMWLTFLREYVMPMQLKQYIGYEHDPPRADLAFVVRYHPAEQASLRPHHDSSTYTLNIALNTPKVDYEGGGCRFVRYNCSVVDSRKGWALIHPGRLTHYHEGLPVTNGTRYIMVTFVDP